MPLGLVSYYEIKSLAKHDIQYRYICEQCNYITEWAKATIIQKACAIQKLGKIVGFQSENKNKLNFYEDRMLSIPDIQIQLDAEANNKLEFVIGKIKRLLELDSYKVILENEPFVVEIYNDIFSLGKSCPNCGKCQTWYPAFSESQSIITSVKNSAFIFSFLSTILFIIVVGFTKFNVAKMIIYTGLVTIISAIIGSLYGCIKINWQNYNYKKMYKNISVKRKPEVEW